MLEPEHPIKANIDHKNLRLMPLSGTYLVDMYLGLTDQKDHSTGKEHHHG